ncbi:hypothetical protein AJOOGB_AJOOGB_17470, partial [Dysosmobacter welbionis]
GFLSEVAAREADGGAHGSQPVIDTGVGRVLRVLQFLQREVGRGDQRLVASVTAVNHAVNLFQPVFCSSLHTKIIKYQQGVAAKAGNIFVPAIKAGSKVIEYGCKVCHTDGNLFLHKGVGDTGGKVAFSCPHAAPKQVADIFSLHGFPALHIKAGGFGLRVSAVVMLKCPVPHSRVGKAPAFQVLHFFKVLLSAFGGLLLFTGCPLAVAVC